MDSYSVIFVLFLQFWLCGTVWFRLEIFVPAPFFG